MFRSYGAGVVLGDRLGYKHFASNWAKRGRTGIEDLIGPRRSVGVKKSSHDAIFIELNLKCCEDPLRRISRSLLQSILGIDRGVFLW